MTHSVTVLEQTVNAHRGGRNQHLRDSKESAGLGVLGAGAGECQVPTGVTGASHDVSVSGLPCQCALDFANPVVPCQSH